MKKAPVSPALTRPIFWDDGRASPSRWKDNIPATYAGLPAGSPYRGGGRGRLFIERKGASFGPIILKLRWRKPSFQHFLSFFSSFYICCVCFFNTLATAEYHTSALSRDIFNKHLTPKLRNTWPMANMNYSNGNQDNFASNSENQDSLFPSLFFLSSSHFLPVLSFFLSFFLSFLILSSSPSRLLEILTALISMELTLLNKPRWGQKESALDRETVRMFVPCGCCIPLARASQRWDTCGWVLWRCRCS